MRPSEIHRRRRTAILLKRPELKQLFGHCPYVAGIAIILVAAQLSLAALFSDAPAWQAILAAILVGAFIGHWLNCVIHEASHNLVFDGTGANKIIAIVANIPSLAPSAMGFRHYHLLHHAHLGEFRLDADVSPAWEIKLVGASPLRKFAWLVLMPLIYVVIHPLHVRKRLPLDGWLFTNAVLVVGTAIAIGIYLGWSSLLYLALSTYLAVGPHPTGAHILQEHINFSGQSYETASYYGPINVVSFNHGFHQEHHDFINVPGLRLRQVRRLAHEFYSDRFAHYSRLKLLWQFIFDRRVSLASRLVADAPR